MHALRFFSISLLCTVGGVLAACTLPDTPTADVDAQVAAAVEETLTAVSADETGAETPATSATIPEAPTEQQDAVSVTSPTVPMLITPTPDRSTEMMQYIVENTRYFKGNSAAPVTIVEFSDFQ